MSKSKLDAGLEIELALLKQEGRAKPPERVITACVPPAGNCGPRYRLAGQDLDYIRLNSNSYLSLSFHPEVLAAADQAAHAFGVGPGAVRFIDGTFYPHIRLEERIAAFVNKPAAKIFNSAYTANCGLALTLSNKKTYWIGDQLNHNSIIRAMRMANIPSHHKAIFRHNDMEDLKKCLDAIPQDMERVVVVFDGVFSMRGDWAPIQRIADLCKDYDERFTDGVVTVVDDSHGIGAYGETGRGTAEHTGAWPDIVVGTFGKAFGVNGGFVCGTHTLVEAVRQKADTYIYTNPLSAADCAAAYTAIDICDSSEGRDRLAGLSAMTQKFRAGLASLGLESLPGPHPVVPLFIRDTSKTHALVNHLFEYGILAVGLTFPVVPEGDETIRFQINAGHREQDLDYVLGVLEKFISSWSKA